MLKSMSMVFGEKQWIRGNPHGCIVGNKSFEESELCDSLSFFACKEKKKVIHLFL